MRNHPFPAPRLTGAKTTRPAVVVTLALALTLAMALVGVTATPATAVDTISDTITIHDADVDRAPSVTALRFSQATFEDGSVDEVLLATDAAFADALASGTLQGGDTPLLLTAPDDLRGDVAGEIDRLGATDVTILGGVDAVDDSVEEALAETGLDVTRVAGETRIQTAIEVASLAPETATAIVARGFSSQGDDTQAFADALAAGSWAAEEGWPILLTQTDALSADTGAAIADLGVERVVLLGGEAAIGAEVAEDLDELGVDVDRIAGATRFDTAVAVAEQRGFDSAADADRIILVEGQADDAWAAGFAAAAHGAMVPAPVVLANGDALPGATVEFLVSTAFAVDAADVEGPVLVCAAAPAACERARLLLGLPHRAEVTFDHGDEPVPSRSQLTGTIALFDEDATIVVFGDCVADGLVVPAEDGTVALDVQAAPGPCELLVEITFANGSVQLVEETITVEPAVPASGTVTGTETGQDAYTFAALGEEADDVPAPLRVEYDEADTFVVDGQPATIGAFEAAVTVADRITFSADTAEGTIHDLTNVDPAAISGGTVGQVDLGAATFAIVEPATGVVLRDGLVISDELTFNIDGADAARAAFEADVNEGDTIQITGSQLALTNETVRGPVNTIQVDVISGIARFRAGALGDDPLNAEDDRFRARAGTDTQIFRVDGRRTDFAAFAQALSDGDGMIHLRERGVELFALRNEPLPPTSGLVTETSNPDGSPVAPEPGDGGSILLLTSTGRQQVVYSADAVFRIDGALATEPEFEAARTPGDEVTYQPADSGTGTAEEITVVNGVLAGEITDITEGANTYDVAIREGVVYDDLDYTAGVLGGADAYVINGETTGLAQFENALALVDRGEVLGSIVVRAVAEGTEHRLTTQDR